MRDLMTSGFLALDVTTLLVVATAITGLLGIFLLLAWRRDGLRALAWWGTAYLVAAVAMVTWLLEGELSPPLPNGAANALLLAACGMAWAAARVFQGRRVAWPAIFAGAGLWLIACSGVEFGNSMPARVALVSTIASVYSVLTAAELWHERRRALRRKWPVVMPAVQAVIFLCPTLFAGV